MEGNPKHQPPTLPNMQAYMQFQFIPDYDTLLTTWLAYTEPLMHLAIASMDLAEVVSYGWNIQDW